MLLFAADLDPKLCDETCSELTLLLSCCTVVFWMVVGSTPEEVMLSIVPFIAGWLSLSVECSMSDYFLVCCFETML